MTITTKKFKTFQNKWVAIDEKKQSIVASGKNIADVQQKAQEKASNDSKIILKYIYPFNSYISPSSK